MSTSEQARAHEHFRALHAGPGAFIMPNAWDGTSALIFRDAGFQALGSSSLALAFSLGRPDGRHAVTRSEAVAHAALLAEISALPVNGDLEDGFGPEAADCAATVEAAIDAGLAGVGIEDTTADPSAPIHDFDRAVERVRAAVHASGGRAVITARADNFLVGRQDLEDTVRRLEAFAEVGADVLYAPALPDMAAIRLVVDAVAPKPLNVLIGPRTGGATFEELQAAGVRRVSLGGAVYRQTMGHVLTMAKALSMGDLSFLRKPAPIPPPIDPRATR